VYAKGCDVAEWRREGEMSLQYLLAVMTNGIQQAITFEEVLSELKKALGKSEEEQARICIALVEKTGCSDHIKRIVLDKSHGGPLRRFALRVGSGCRDATYNDFIRSEILAAKSKAQLMAEWESGNTDGAELGLYTSGEEIFTTPDFFRRYVARGYRK
jgi:hypothetical protein